MTDTPAAAPAAPLSDLFATTAKGPAAGSFTWSLQARSLDGVHGWLKAVLFAHIGANAVTALTLVVMLWFFATLSSGAEVNPALGMMMVTVGTIAQILPVIVLGVFVACVICYLLFVHRAVKNLHVSNARGLSVSPGWAVGYSFIPFVNLVMVYRIMKEIWEVSNDPERGRREAPLLLGWWWGLYIGGNVLSRISDALSSGLSESTDPADYFSAFAPGGTVGMVSAAISIGSTFCLLAIIRQVREAQETLRATAAFED
jgi:hypothetical protein